jgi:hypothetical protein
MRISDPWWLRFFANWLVLLLLVPFGVASPLPQQAESESRLSDGAPTKFQADSSKAVVNEAKAPSSKFDQPSFETLPNSPGTVRLQAVANNQPFPQAQQGDVQEPVGTAAAPAVKTTGVAASRPAGAAIAPRKQRRARSLLIKVGAFVGAGVAIGTVVALSSASPSRPPGSR